MTTQEQRNGLIAFSKASNKLDIRVDTESDFLAEMDEQLNLLLEAGEKFKWKTAYGVACELYNITVEVFKKHSIM